MATLARHSSGVCVCVCVQPTVEPSVRVYREGVGKYIPKAGVKRSQADGEIPASGTKRPHIEEAKHSAKTQLSDFSAW